MDKWQRLRSKIVLDTPYFRIRQDACRLSDGREIDDYYVQEAEDIVMVVAITPDQDIVLVRQYKHGIGDICLEIPAGFCEANSPDPLDDAQRELREETGYTSDTWHKLTTLICNPTRFNNHAHVYLALNVSKTSTQDLDPNESIQVEHIATDAIKQAIWDGRIAVSDSITSIMMALDWLTHD
jgi:8-oxo-dGTP pyrophosphatase MutT (NUDIX family)